METCAKRRVLFWKNIESTITQHLLIGLVSLAAAFVLPAEQAGREPPLPAVSGGSDDLSGCRPSLSRDWARQVDLLGDGLFMSISRNLI
jgi:hypothetical protein